MQYNHFLLVKKLKNTESAHLCQSDYKNELFLGLA